MRKFIIAITVLFTAMNMTGQTGHMNFGPSKEEVTSAPLPVTSLEEAERELLAYVEQNFSDLGDAYVHPTITFLDLYRQIKKYEQIENKTSEYGKPPKSIGAALGCIAACYDHWYCGVYGWGSIGAACYSGLQNCVSDCWANNKPIPSPIPSPTIARPPLEILACQADCFTRYQIYDWMSPQAANTQIYLLQQCLASCL